MDQRDRNKAMIGIARLQVSMKALESALFIPDGIRIEDIRYNAGDDCFSVILIGEGLPTLDETGGEMKLASMTVKARYIKEIYESELKIGDSIVANWVNNEHPLFHS